MPKKTTVMSRLGGKIKSRMDKIDNAGADPVKKPAPKPKPKPKKSVEKSVSDSFWGN